MQFGSVIAAAAATAMIFASPGAASEPQAGTGDGHAVTDSVEGWVTFGEGLHVWKSREVIGDFSPENCVSGVLPRALFDQAARTLPERRVRISGRFTGNPPSPDGIGEQRVRYYRGTRFENSCGADRVMLGERIELAPE